MANYVGLLSGSYDPTAKNSLISSGATKSSLVGIFAGVLSAPRTNLGQPVAKPSLLWQPRMPSAVCQSIRHVNGFPGIPVVTTEVCTPFGCAAVQQFELSELYAFDSSGNNSLFQMEIPTGPQSTCGIPADQSDALGANTGCTSRQSSSTDSATFSESNCSGTAAHIDRQNSTSSAQSSTSRVRVSHVITLRGRYPSARVRRVCGCCFAEYRYPVRKAPAPAGRRRTHTDSSSSTVREARCYVHSFLLIPDSDGSESVSDCESAMRSFGSDSDDDDDDDDSQTESKPDADDLELLFVSFGLVNIERPPVCTRVPNSNRQYTRSPPLRNSNKSTKSNEPESWTELDKRERTGGLSYTYALTVVQTRNLSAALQQRLRGVKKRQSSDSQTNNESPEFCGTQQLDKKVRFADDRALKRVHLLCTWRYWANQARQDVFLQRKKRFEFTVARCAPTLNAILSNEHRSRVFLQRFASSSTEGASASDIELSSA